MRATSHDPRRLTVMRSLAQVGPSVLLVDAQPLAAEGGNWAAARSVVGPEEWQPERHTRGVGELGQRAQRDAERRSAVVKLVLAGRDLKAATGGRHHQANQDHPRKGSPEIAERHAQPIFGE